jgi:hypothetical protein
MSGSGLINSRLLVVLVIALTSLGIAGCGFISPEAAIDEAIVNAPTLKIRSSTAMVALDIAEVKRGDRVDILEQAQVRTPTRIDEWYKVRTKGTDEVIGWVESRYLINKAVVDKIEELYEKSRNIIPQGQGRLKVQARLRIEPGGDVATLLSKRTAVDIVGKARTTYKPEKQESSDDADEPTEEPETRTVLWYQVRLPDSEVLRAGWIGAQQVQLDVPEEILHLEGEGRRFTGWVVFDQTKGRDGKLRNNYIGLMKSVDTSGPIDFTRLWVLIYAPDHGRYFGAHIESGLRGVLPVSLGTASGAKGFTIHELDANGNSVPIEYQAIRMGPSRLSVKRLSPKIEVKSPPKKGR